MIGVNIDITEAREAETALRESEQRFRSMADSAPAPVWVSGPEGGIDFVNRAMIEFFGGDETAPLGLAWLERIHPDDLPAAKSIREKALVRQTPFAFEARFRNGAGQWRWMSAATSPRFGDDGAFLGYVGIANDVTHTREAQAALSEQTSRSRFLLELGDRLRDLENPGAIMLAAARALGEKLAVARVGYGEVEDDETHVVIGADWTHGDMPSATGRYLMEDFGPDLSRDLKDRVRVAVPDVREDPRTAEAAGAFEAIETRAFLRDLRLYELEWEELPELLVPNMRVDIRPEYVVAEYRKLYPEYSPSEVFFAATTAARSWRAAIIEAEERAKQAGANTYVYQLNWESPVKPEMGAPHGFDIPLVFGNLDTENSLTGTGAEARTVSATMSDAFIGFARNAVPDHEGLPNWKPYSLASRETMIFDYPPRLENDPRGAERRLFATVPYVQPGT